MNRCVSCFKTFQDEYDICPYCGQPVVTEPIEPIQLHPGTVLANRYVIGLALGAGGFGIVYRAWDNQLQTVVAIKEFFISRMMTRAPGQQSVIVTSKAQAEFEYRKTRFLAEARNMAKFNKHRSIPNVYEFFEENNTAYIVMELLEGKSLNSYMKECGGRLPVDFAVYVAKEVAGALKSLHEQKIIHRDVAPDNIYICNGNEIRIKLMDLGAAKLSDTEEDVIDIILKPGYSPTEQYDNNGAIGPWTDIYALGATLYMMITGVKPDESTNRKIEDLVVPANTINTEIDENLNNTIMKCLALESHMRFQNINELMQALDGKKKVKSLAAERRSRSIRRTVGILGGLAAVLVAGFVAISMFRNKQSEVTLKPADLTIWISVEEGSTEEAAMQSVIKEFTSVFPDVSIDLEAIPAEEYAEKLDEAAKKGKLPTLFESSGASNAVIHAANNLQNVLDSEQAAQCMFLQEYYHDYYGKIPKQIPLGMEIPMAYVITNGPVYLKYDESTFTDLSAFDGALIAADSRYSDLLLRNFGGGEYLTRETFLDGTENTCAVLLSSSMITNEVRTELINYSKSFVFCDADAVYCHFIYEWSIFTEDEAEQAAAETLLSWMLSNAYQTTLMVTECSDGQIPLEPDAFSKKLSAGKLLPLKKLIDNLEFEEYEGAEELIFVEGPEKTDNAEPENVAESPEMIPDT